VLSGWVDEGQGPPCCCRRHRHAGGHTGKQHAAGHLHGRAHQRLGVGAFLVGAPQRDGQAAAQGLQHLHCLGHVARAHDQAGRAEHLVVQLRRGDEAGGVDLGQHRPRRLGRGGAFVQQRLRAGAAPARHAGVEGLAQAGRQHGVRLLRGQGRGQLPHEGVAGRVVQQHDHARAGAELAAAQRDGAGQRGRQLGAPGAQHGRQRDDGLTEPSSP
jgi:hypothetical protein